MAIFLRSPWTMRRSFDLQFFGGGGTTTEQVRKRDPEPEELVELRKRFIGITDPGMDYQEGNYDPNDTSIPPEFHELIERVNKLQEAGDDTLYTRLPEMWDRYDESLDMQKDLIENGVPQHFQDNLYESINRNARENMGGFLAKAAGTGTINSTVSNVGLNNINRESQDQMSSKYLDMFGALGNQMGQYSDQARLGIGEARTDVDFYNKQIRDAWQDYYLPSMGGYKFWNDWQESYDRREDYDTVVHQGK